MADFSIFFQMKQIFQNVGLRIPDQTFEDAWSLASSSHPAGDVCVESFRNVLSELQNAKLEKEVYCFS